MITTLLSHEQYRALQLSKDERSDIELPSSKEIFEHNVEKLVTEGLATYEQADAFRDSLLESGLFLWIPPRPAEITRDWLNALMEKIEHKGRHGKNYLEVAHLENRIEIPSHEKGYIMTDIEDGYGRRNTRCSESLAQIRSEGRSPYTAIEGAFHALVYPQVLESHYMDLVGSRCYGSWVFLRVVGDRPGLGHGGSGALPTYGAPMCRERIVV